MAGVKKIRVILTNFSAQICFSPQGGCTKAIVAEAGHSANFLR